MKVFISFSGTKSHAIAEIFREHIDAMFDAVKPWLSGRDIESGARWRPEITEQLDESNYGILILLPENRTSEWIHFEAGSLAKSTDKGRVCALLFDDLKPTDVKGPLEQFQNREFNKSNYSKLLQDINSALETPIAKEVFTERLDGAWTKISKQCAEIVKTTPASGAGKSGRTDRSLLEEVLSILRGIERKGVNSTAVYAPAATLEGLIDRSGHLSAGFMDEIAKIIGPGEALNLVRRIEAKRRAMELLESEIPSIDLTVPPDPDDDDGDSDESEGL